MSTAAYSYMIDMTYSLLPSVVETDDILPGPAGLSTYLYILTKGFTKIGRCKRTYLRQGQPRCYD
jgi:hypothetical protein